MTIALSRLNFRDIGGLAAADGRRLRNRVLYRSEGPASFTAVHRGELADLGIRLICDLRKQSEREAAPNDWSGSARLFNLAVDSDPSAATHASWNVLRLDPSDAGARASMRLSYRSMPAALHPHLAGLVDACNAGEIPLLIHCTAGKDRTGVLVALLLTALGVTHEDVVADYLRSSIFGENLRLGGPLMGAFEASFGFAPSEAAVDVMIGVDRDYLDSAFDALAQQWGSVERYFSTAGLDGARLERFRAALLTTDPQVIGTAP
jgi:protein-tyrosine phosphatase